MYCGGEEEERFSFLWRSGRPCSTALGIVDTPRMDGVQRCGAEQRDTHKLKLTYKCFHFFVMVSKLYVPSQPQLSKTMSPVLAMDKTLLMILLWNLWSLPHLEGLPVSKRSISEVQLMHNVGERKQVLERQDWLQVKLKSILIPSWSDSFRTKLFQNTSAYDGVERPDLLVCT
ncbi:hypothetical protein SRHO_G00169660 [Serrasalmus rhombeus]